jgi:hypothetical protein
VGLSVLLRQTRRPVGRIRPGAGDPPRPEPASRLRTPHMYWLAAQSRMWATASRMSRIIVI